MLARRSADDEPLVDQTSMHENKIPNDRGRTPPPAHLIVHAVEIMSEYVTAFAD